MSGEIVTVDFGKLKKRYLMGCPECDGIDWNVIMDPGTGEAISNNPDIDIDMECSGITCANCGYHIDMQGSPLN